MRSGVEATQMSKFLVIMVLVYFMLVKSHLHILETRRSRQLSL